MAHYDQTNAEIHVYTFKEGLLSAVGHDLLIGATRFSLDVGDASLDVSARVEANSLRVLHALRGGAPAPSALNDGDRRSIDKAIAAEVLQAARYPVIEFRSTLVTREESAGRYAISGKLALHGRERAVQLLSLEKEGGQVVEFELDQRDFGIKPYSAMLGALKVRPEVKVVVRVPASARR